MTLLVFLIVLTTATTYHQLRESERNNTIPEPEQVIPLREDEWYLVHVHSFAIGGSEFVRGTIGEMRLLVSETDNNTVRFELMMNGSENATAFPGYVDGIFCRDDLDRIWIPTNSSVPVEIEFQRNEDGSYILRSVKPLRAGNHEIRDLETEIWFHSRINELMADFPHDEDDEVWTKGIESGRKGLPAEIV